jgi:tetratricopeptide (TPR) repeat protein
MRRNNKGLALATSALQALRAGRRAEAEYLGRKALAKARQDANVLHAVGELTWELGDVSAASALLADAIRRRGAGAPAPWHLKLAQAWTLLGRVDDAKRTFQTGLAQDPRAVLGWLGLGRALHRLGDFCGAIDAWERAIALDPRAWTAHNDLGSARMEMRDWTGAGEAFAKAESLSCGDPIVLVNRASLDLRSGHPEDAIARLEASTARYPEYAPAHAGLGFAWRDVGQSVKAVTPLRRAVALDPESASYTCGLGRALLESGDAHEALAVAAGYLKRRPGHSGARALESLTRLALGDNEGVALLLDYQRFVSVSTLPAPDGFDDLAAFNAALALHTSTHRTLNAAPLSHATAVGLHSGSLLVQPRGPIAVLEQAVGTAAVSYWRALSSSDHPWGVQRPRAVFLKMWCVVLDRGGHQTPHIHPEAWLSGVYYPKLPESVRTGPGPAGWLEFGKPDGLFPSRIVPPTLQIQPVEGTMVVFPSYFYHRTIPLEEPGTRISIAFDVVPVEPRSWVDPPGGRGVLDAAR